MSPYPKTSIEEVACLTAPKFLSIHVLPVVGLVTSTTVVVLFKLNQFTVRVKVHALPPIFSAKLAVPADVAVPVIV